MEEEEKVVLFLYWKKKVSRRCGMLEEKNKGMLEEKNKALKEEG